MALITWAEYQVLQPGTGLTEAQFNLIEPAVTEAIQAYCNLEFTADTRDELYDGSGLYWLRLRAVPSAVTQVTYQPNHTNPTVYNGDQFLWTTTGELYFIPTAERQGFDGGWQNWQVEYTTDGTTPAMVKLAAGKLIYRLEQLLDPDVLVSEYSIGQAKIKFDVELAAGLEEVSDYLTSAKRHAYR